MFFQHIYDKSLAQASYLIGCQKTGESIVIDPKRDVDTYIDIAKQNGLRITHVINMLKKHSLYSFVTVD